MPFGVLFRSGTTLAIYKGATQQKSRKRRVGAPSANRQAMTHSDRGAVICDHDLNV